MKKLILIFFVCFLSINVWSQEIFNIIVEDTSSHITSSVVALDTGYVILTGTGNNMGIRSFSIQYIDDHGQRIWKKIYDHPDGEVWEGYANCLKKNEQDFSCTGILNSNSSNDIGMFLSIFDNKFNLSDFVIFKYDAIFKRAFNQIRTVDNYYFITGQVYDPSLDDAFMYLLKVDTVGNLIWDKRYGQRNESGEQIIETSDKNILIGGLTFSFPTTTTDEDWYLIKLDTAGNVIWQNGFGRPGYLNYDGAVAGLIETSDSNYIACGGYPAVRSDCDTYWDGCIRKVSKDGDLMWERFYRSYFSMTNPVTDWFLNHVSSVVYKNNDLFVLGNWRSGIGRARGYLQKITENGDICWNREYFAIDYLTNNQYFVSFQPTSDNGFIIAGFGNDYDTHGYFPSQQAWLVKTDSLGIDGLCYTEPPELNIDIVLPETVNCSDTITVYAYIAGKSAPYTIETSIGQVIDSIYYPPLFVPVEIGLSEAEIDCGGNIIYTQQITEATLSNHEWGQCIAKPVEFYTPHTSGLQQINITVTDAYGESKTITKEVLVNDNCGNGISEEVVNSISLYPNPAKDKVYVDVPQDIIPVSTEIYNVSGQLVATPTIHKGLNVIEVLNMPSGIYVLKINSYDNTFSLSFEKQN